MVCEAVERANSCGNEQRDGTRQSHVKNAHEGTMFDVTQGTSRDPSDQSESNFEDVQKCRACALRAMENKATNSNLHLPILKI